MDIRFRSNQSLYESLSVAAESVAQQNEASELSKAAKAVSSAINSGSIATLSPSSNYYKNVASDIASVLRKNLLFEALQTPKFNFKPLPTPLFVTGSGDANSVAMNDVSQGQLRNCWMMAPMAELAAKDPEAIKRMIQKNPDGTYTVTFKERQPFLSHGIFGTPVYHDKKITVSADFPGGVNGTGHAGTGDKNALGQGEIWPLIIEKAYAQYKGGYDQINKNGDAGQFMEAMTGRPSQTQIPNGGFILGGGYGFDQMRNDFNSGKTMTFLSRDTVNGKYGIVGDHYYAVQNVYTDANGKKMVQLYNPWGYNHPQPIPYDEAFQHFENISVN